MSLEIKLENSLTIIGENNKGDDCSENYSPLRLLVEGQEVGTIKNFRICGNTAYLHGIELEEHAKSNKYGTKALKSIVGYARKKGIRKFVGEKMGSEAVINYFIKMVYDNDFGVKNHEVSGDSLILDI